MIVLLWNIVSWSFARWWYVWERDCHSNSKLSELPSPLSHADWGFRIRGWGRVLGTYMHIYFIQLHSNCVFRSECNLVFTSSPHSFLWHSMLVEKIIFPRYEQAFRRAGNRKRSYWPPVPFLSASLITVIYIQMYIYSQM